MKGTRYFEEQVLRKRPYLDLRMIGEVLENPSRRQTQGDGRLRFWGEIVDPRDGSRRVLRVVTLDDGETIHNAFFDRGFREDQP
jgi:hypothetical protein